MLLGAAELARRRARRRPDRGGGRRARPDAADDAASAACSRSTAATSGTATSSAASSSARGWPTKTDMPGRRLPRDRRARLRRPAARDARRQRARCSRAGSHDDGYRLRAAGRPTGPRRPAPARPGCCTATTTTCPRSAGGRRTAARAIVTNHPQDAAEIERRHSDGRGLLHADGASRANILSGDAPHSMLTMSTVLDRDRPGPARAGLLRVLRQPVRRRPHAAAGDRRDLHRALVGDPAGAPRRPAARSTATGATRSCAPTRP